MSDMNPTRLPAPVDIGGDHEVSMFALATILLRSRWRIARWIALGVVVAAVWAFTRPPLYTASASFVPQGSDAARSGLAGIAGQFGVTLPGTSAALSPDFYAQLLQSRELLGPIALDTFAVAEQGGRRRAFADLLKIDPGPTKVREEEGIKRLGKIVNVSVSRNTGVVGFSVTTRWPSVSLAITSALVDAVNAFNVRTRQEQASEEREFVEGRLNEAKADLRAAEDRLAAFLAANRQLSNSPELTFQRERLQRDVSTEQQLYSTLAQSYEEVRMREVRATPVITMFESPSVPSKPEPRGRIKILALGVVLGAFIGIFLSLVHGIVERRRRTGDAEVDAFFTTLGELRSNVGGRLRPGKRRSAAGG